MRTCFFVASLLHAAGRRNIVLVAAKEHISGMALNGSILHHRPDQKFSARDLWYIGSVAEWRPFLAAFEAFRQIEMLDHAETLHLLSDLVLGQKKRWPVASTGKIMLNEVLAEGLFIDATLLQNLAAGCKELLLMARHDRFDAFRGTLCDGWAPRYGREPLLNDIEDRLVRSLARRTIGLVDNDSLRYPTPALHSENESRPFPRHCGLQETGVPHFEMLYLSGGRIHRKETDKPGVMAAADHSAGILEVCF
ncbi:MULTISPECIES: hypothetical protein [unclassified Rhizobium]|uniref:hypothetical protein n=1 Tax=unclassified Rhizobium TaxID=2613769 RepID=UPI0007EBA8C5|nr:MULTISPECIES: hypothetical protein [unclassified Rhizobium]ANM09231.1 hypothetical protein AMK05_CH00802 [Rhizobium sp. N324]OYD02799.1 hypothetical protein AMK08_CH100798 [Rhizobium sp. N4311]